MYAFIKIFFAGLIISLLGTLPLGTLNISSLQIAMSDGYMPALSFAMGVLIVEVFYVRITLIGIEWLQKQKKWLTIFEWVTVLLLFLLAFGSFFTAFSLHPEKNILLPGGLPRFWLGVTMSAINPVQIPFWLGWNMLLFSKKILKPQKYFYIFYVMGIGLGTFMGHALFIFGGSMLEEYLSNRDKEIQLVIGSVFILTAFWQVYRLMRVKKR